MSRTMKGAGERERERVTKQVESKSISSCVCLRYILSAKCTHPRRELVKACEGMSMWTNTHVGCVHSQVHGCTHHNVHPGACISLIPCMHRRRCWRILRRRTSNALWTSKNATWKRIRTCMGKVLPCLSSLRHLCVLQCISCYVWL